MTQTNPHRVPHPLSVLTTNLLVSGPYRSIFHVRKRSLREVPRTSEVTQQVPGSRLARLAPPLALSNGLLRGQPRSSLHRCPPSNTLLTHSSPNISRLSSLTEPLSCPHLLPFLTPLGQPHTSLGHCRFV